MSNLAAILHWALHNGQTAKARLIAAHLIAGTEPCGSDIW